LLAISDRGWEMLKQFKGTTTPPLAYIPHPEGDLIPISVKLRADSLHYFTSNNIPVFNTEVEADEFGQRCYDFNNLSRISSHSAQKYWANFRIKIVDAINYKELLNIRPGEDRDFTHHDKKFLKKADYYKKKNIPKSRTDESFFW
jgi:hypothetical protein